MTTTFDELKAVLFAPTIAEAAPMAERPMNAVTSFKYFDFQLKTLQRMYDIEANNKYIPRENHMNECSACVSHVAVLANKPGSGKSAIVLSLCCKKCPAKNELIYQSSNGFSQMIFHPRRRGTHTEVNCNLIVVPPKIMDQWVKYMRDFHSIPYAVIRQGQQAMPKDAEELVELANSVRILFVSASLLGKMRPFIHQVQFDRVFLDEIQDMTYPECQGMDLRCNFLWIISATPEDFLLSPRPANGRTTGSNIPYNFREYLRSAFDFNNCDTEIARYFIARCDNEYIDRCMNIPTYTLEEIGVPPSAAIRLVEGIVPDNHFANLVHGDRIQEAIQALHVTGQTKETLQEAVTMWLEYRITNLEADLKYQRDFVAVTQERKERKEIAIRKITGDLEALRAKRYTLLERIQQCSDCPICLGELDNPVALKCCLKTFCFPCLQNWIPTKASCPNCRHPVASIDDLLHMVTRKRSVPTGEENANAGYATAAGAAEEAERPPRSKMEAMMRILQTARKTLIYITDDGDDKAKQIKDRLVEEGIRVFSLMRLTSVGCSNVIKNFEETQEKACMVVNCIQHGAGFNLQFVDTIIMYQRMPMYQTQIIGRGMRPGRTEPLKVFRLHYDFGLLPGRRAAPPAAAAVVDLSDSN